MPEPKSGPSLKEIAVFVLLAALLVLIFRSVSGRVNVVPVGTPLPEMMTQGWLNAPEAVSREGLAGKVVLVDCWATWCPPCRRSLPTLAKVYATYHPKGVEFVGLTAEEETDRSVIEETVKGVPGFDWPVGFGAFPTMDMLGITAYPTLILFDTSGRAVWSSNSTSGLEAALDKALGR